ncbi:MAG TPA: cytochrome c [bacterium]|jgi:thiosulfate dehydrogenase|nr:cytochrome c [bacterium]
MMKAFFWGVGLTVLAGLLGAYLFIVTGSMPANADSPPPAVERWMAHTSLRASIKREAPQGPNPEAFTDDNLTAGIKLYQANCLVCHGAADGKASNIAQGLYQHAPQLAGHGVEDDPEGETYWKVSHGIRMTGMPGFSKSLSDAQVWQLALFLKHMDALTPAADKVWKALPSAAAAK